MTWSSNKLQRKIGSAIENARAVAIDSVKRAKPARGKSNADGARLLSSLVLSATAHLQRMMMFRPIITIKERFALLMGVAFQAAIASMLSITIHYHYQRAITEQLRFIDEQ